MGLLRLLQQMRRSDNQCRILLLGLDNAGKTTILKNLCNEDPTETSPTRGFNVKTVQADSFKFNVWDIGGQKAIRQYWDNYYEGTDALVWVVDCADEPRLEETSLELTQILADPKMANVPVLIFANKQDLPGALSGEELKKVLELPDDIPVYDATATSVVDGKCNQGVNDATSALITVIVQNHEKLRVRVDEDTKEQEEIERKEREEKMERLRKRQEEKSSQSE